MEIIELVAHDDSSTIFQACINLIAKKERVMEGAAWEKLKKKSPGLATEVLDKVNAILRKELAEEKKMIRRCADCSGYYS